MKTGHGVIDNGEAREVELNAVKGVRIRSEHLEKGGEVAHERFICEKNLGDMGRA